jgi:hypothetical protein
MNAQTPATPTERPVTAASTVEEGIGDSVRKEAVGTQKTKADVAAETGAEGIKSLIDRVASSSVMELEGLISELHEVRDFLKSEGERVQREITNYAQLNQTALTAVKIITDTISPWKSTALDGNAHSTSGGPLFAVHKLGKRAPAVGASSR